MELKIVPIHMLDVNLILKHSHGYTCNDVELVQVQG